MLKLLLFLTTKVEFKTAEPFTFTDFKVDPLFTSREEPTYSESFNVVDLFTLRVDTNDANPVTLTSSSTVNTDLIVVLPATFKVDFKSVPSLIVTDFATSNGNVKKLFLQHPIYLIHLLLLKLELPLAVKVVEKLPELPDISPSIFAKRVPFSSIFIVPVVAPEASVVLYLIYH